MQDFIVTATLFHAVDQLIIIHSQKSDAFFIKTFAEIGLVIHIQLLLGVSADFIQHPSKVDEPANFCGRSAKA